MCVCVLVACMYTQCDCIWPTREPERFDGDSLPHTPLEDRIALSSTHHVPPHRDMVTTPLEKTRMGQGPQEKGAMTERGDSETLSDLSPSFFNLSTSGLSARPPPPPYARSPPANSHSTRSASSQIFSTVAPKYPSLRKSPCCPKAPRTGRSLSAELVFQPDLGPEWS